MRWQKKKKQQNKNPRSIKSEKWRLAWNQKQVVKLAGNTRYKVQEIKASWELQADNHCSVGGNIEKLTSWGKEGEVEWAGWKGVAGREVKVMHTDTGLNKFNES